jgi:dTDP-4-dehydrorhamnose 3,5-epimerase
VKITETEIPGLLIIHPDIYEDDRGYFYESYNERIFRGHGIEPRFVQDNESRSVRNVIRGLHYQLSPYAQTKLLRVLEGTILDVAVDMRKNSPAYGKWEAIEVSAGNRFQVLIPKGCAHGFRVISKYATVLYKCDEFYMPEYERGILYSDEALGINWGIGSGKVIVSAKDRKAALFAEADNNF